MFSRIIALLLLSGHISTAHSETAPQVLLKTNMGNIVLELNPAAAPVTVANFLSYVDDESYNNTIFHRVIPNFMIQGGGHYLDMTEAPEGDVIINEAENGLKNVRGSVAMARTNKIDSAGRQFFINVKHNKFLDHSSKSCTREDEAAAEEAREKGLYRPQSCKSFGYAVFGKVVDGMDVVDLIELSDTNVLGPHDDVPVIPVILLDVSRVTESPVPAEAVSASTQ